METKKPGKKVSKPKIVKKPIVVKKKQIELGDQDISYLGANQYSEKAWEVIGRKHQCDPATREPIPGSSNRSYLVVHKVWPREEPVNRGGILTKEGTVYRTLAELDHMMNTSSPELTKPMNDEPVIESFELPK